MFLHDFHKKITELFVFSLCISDTQYRLLWRYNIIYEMGQFMSLSEHNFTFPYIDTKMTPAWIFCFHSSRLDLASLYGSMCVRALMRERHTATCICLPQKQANSSAKELSNIWIHSWLDTGGVQSGI